MRINETKIRKCGNKVMALVSSIGVKHVRP